MRSSLKNNRSCNGSITLENGNGFICIPVGQRTRKRKMVNCQAPLSCCYLVFTFCALLSLRSVICEQSVNPPTKCEACVLFVREFEQQLTSNGPVQRSRSERELWLLEAMEGQCVRMLDYKLHKEKQGLARFSKQQSSTMKTLNKLRERGVKVELGMPYELWDKPSVEVASLKQQCELILERYEDDIEQWFFSTDRLPLEKYLCEQRVLKGGDLSCIGNVHSEL